MAFVSPLSCPMRVVLRRLALAGDVLTFSVVFGVRVRVEVEVTNNSGSIRMSRVPVTDGSSVVVVVVISAVRCVVGSTVVVSVAVVRLIVVVVVVVVEVDDDDDENVPTA